MLAPVTDEAVIFHHSLNTHYHLPPASSHTTTLIVSFTPYTHMYTPCWVQGWLTKLDKTLLFAQKSECAWQRHKNNIHYTACRDQIGM